MRVTANTLLYKFELHTVPIYPASVAYHPLRPCLSGHPSEITRACNTHTDQKMVVGTCPAVTSNL